MWQFAFSVSVEGVGKARRSVKHRVEGDQVHKGGRCRAGQELICSHQGSQLWYIEPHKGAIIVRYVLYP